MPLKSTCTHYGGMAVVLHWLSAVLILGMIPAGFLMQGVDESVKPVLYCGHVATGALVLVLTLARLTWKLLPS